MNHLTTVFTAVTQRKENNMKEFKGIGNALSNISPLLAGMWDGMAVIGLALTIISWIK
jgi:hypothetical protein